MNEAPIVRDVVLVGGGHSHALLIRRWAMRPLPGVRLTLVSDGVMTPYSGMLPGHLAGHYTVDEVHIDLLRLCTWAGVRFIRARMVGLDPQARTIRLLDRPPIGYDRLSLDTGSTPDLSVAGAAEHATPVKPVSGFVQRWHSIRDRLPGAGAVGDAALRIGVVGSGAGGFEIVMALAHALSDRYVVLHWFLRGSLPLGGRHGSARRAALAAARAAGIEVHARFDVERVDAGPMLYAVDGRRCELDELLWCTGATGPDWPAEAGLATDARGFVSTDAMLRSVSHPEVYATGDIGTQRDSPSVKAGVHAVRQAPVLHDNLRADLLGEPLRAYRPQRDFLSLMATGGKRAIASRGPLTVAGHWVWHWKDRIDRGFMQRFERLPVMRAGSAPALLPDALRTRRPVVGDAGPGTGLGPGLRGAAGTEQPGGNALEAGEALAAPQAMRCRGCGAKVGDELLRQALQAFDTRAPGTAAGHVQTQGLSTRDLPSRDVSVIDPGRRLLVQSVDQLSALFDDPWRFARIAALHALSDVFTVRAQPHSALLVLTLPPADDVVQRRELAMVLDGAGSVLREHGVRLIGGHTAEGPQLQIALTINALAEQCHVEQAAPGPPRPGDALLLTRAIGTGVLFAAAMRSRARGDHLQAAIDAMDRSSAATAARLHDHGASRITDVTGFGLAGHLQALLDGSGVSARLDASAVPVLAGARELATSGVRSSLFEANRAALVRMIGSASLSQAETVLLADPQTAGGLLAVLPAERVDSALPALQALDPDACVIGSVVAGIGPASVTGHS